MTAVSGESTKGDDGGVAVTEGVIKAALVRGATLKQENDH